MENNYKKGDIVSERIRPRQKLIIIDYTNSLYYCMPHEKPTQRELVYFERELEMYVTPIKVYLNNSYPTSNSIY